MIFIKSSSFIPSATAAGKLKIPFLAGGTILIYMSIQHSAANLHALGGFIQLPVRQQCCENCSDTVMTHNSYLLTTGGFNFILIRTVSISLFKREKGLQSTSCRWQKHKKIKNKSVVIQGSSKYLIPSFVVITSNVLHTD